MFRWGFEGVSKGIRRGFEGIQEILAPFACPAGGLRLGHNEKAAPVERGGLINLVLAPRYLGGYSVTSSSPSWRPWRASLFRARPARRRGGPPARGTASSSRRSGRCLWQNFTESGSPPCSPQMPSLMPGRVCVALLDGDLHELAHAGLVNRGERVRLARFPVPHTAAGSCRSRRGSCPGRSG